MDLASYLDGLNSSSDPMNVGGSPFPLWGGNADRGNGSVWEKHPDNDTTFVQRQNQIAWMEMVRACLDHVVIPIVCLIGILGNSFNFYVFYCRWYLKFMNDAEKSVTVGLMSLALSDAMFCVSALPSLFLYAPFAVRTRSPTLYSLTLHYSAYKGFFLNMFIFNSTWLIAAISLQRVVVLSARRGRCCVTHARKTALIHLAIFLVSFVVCLPLLLRYRVVQTPCYENNICYHVEPSGPLTSPPFKTAYQVFWTVFGTIVPLVLLAASNIRLLLLLNRGRISERSAARDPSGNRQITVLVIAMILSFLVLVCPSMVVECLSWILLRPRGDLSKPEAVHVQSFFLATTIANLLQAIKFSFDFLLYVTVNRQFRREFRACKVNDSCRLSKVDREAIANLRLDQPH